MVSFGISPDTDGKIAWPNERLTMFGGDMEIAEFRKDFSSPRFFRVETISFCLQNVSIVEVLPDNSQDETSEEKQDIIKSMAKAIIVGIDREKPDMGTRGSNGTVRASDDEVKNGGLWENAHQEELDVTSDHELDVSSDHELDVTSDYELEDGYNVANKKRNRSVRDDEIVTEQGDHEISILDRYLKCLEMSNGDSSIASDMVLTEHLSSGSTKQKKNR
jgi:hypothetical protein